METKTIHNTGINLSLSLSLSLSNVFIIMNTFFDQKQAINGLVKAQTVKLKLRSTLLGNSGIDNRNNRVAMLVRFVERDNLKIFQLFLSSKPTNMLPLSFRRSIPKLPIADIPTHSFFPTNYEKIPTFVEFHSYFYIKIFFLYHRHLDFIAGV